MWSLDIEQTTTQNSAICVCAKLYGLESKSRELAANPKARMRSLYNNSSGKANSPAGQPLARGEKIGERKLQLLTHSAHDSAQGARYGRDAPTQGSTQQALGTSTSPRTDTLLSTAGPNPGSQHKNSGPALGRGKLPSSPR